MYIYISEQKNSSSYSSMMTSFGAVRPEDSQWHYTVLDDRSFQIRGKTLFIMVVIFSVLLVVSLLFLYARWACRYRRVSSPYPSSQPPNQPTPPPPPQQGLDAAAIKGLPVIAHHSESAAECCICLGVFEDGETVKVLPRCCHCYHPECVDRWLSEQPSCPMCRNSLRVDSAVLKVVVE